MRKIAHRIAATAFALALTAALGFGAQQAFASGAASPGCEVGACNGPNPNERCALCCIQSGGTGGMCFSGACICSG